MAHATASRPVLLLTRPQAQSERFARAVTERLGDGVEIVISPLLEIRDRDADLPQAPRGLIFTSENGVRAYARRVSRRDLPVWCVGDRTAAAARAAGFAAGSAGGDAEALLALLSAEKPAGPLLHLRGAHARGEIAQRLSAAGIETVEAIVYDQVPRLLSPQARAALAGTAPVYAPLFSPRTARLLVDAAAEARAPLHVIAMSAAVAAAAQALGKASISTAERPDAGAMLDLLAHRIAAAGAP
ncbi:uroporphyrinogen-III synthase [Acidimangrovimonas pyrenivorans]|uniref:Uroporphyrinogen-III synthase n=1 Tax=Acidimangrovimonas pyrenivorans TaxID=2030798 RepID=A0ABV7ALP2_9RHOB